MEVELELERVARSHGARHLGRAVGGDPVGVGEDAARLRGWVVARRVWLSHVVVPVFLSVMDAGSVWQVVIASAVVASGQLSLTYVAPYTPALPTARIGGVVDPPPAKACSSASVAVVLVLIDRPEMPLTVRDVRVLPDRPVAPPAGQVRAGDLPVGDPERIAREARRGHVGVPVSLGGVDHRRLAGARLHGGGPRLQVRGDGRRRLSARRLHVGRDRRSPAPSIPTALTTMLACVVGSSPGSKYWYAPRTSPALFMPVQFVANSVSR